MAMIDRVKERISLLKYWIGIVLGVLIAVSAWLFDNLNDVETWKMVVTSGLIVVTVIVIIFLNRMLLKAIDSLEDL